MTAFRLLSLAYQTRLLSTPTLILITFLNLLVASLTDGTISTKTSVCVNILLETAFTIYSLRGEKTPFRIGSSNVPAFTTFALGNCVNFFFSYSQYTK